MAQQLEETNQRAVDAYNDAQLALQQIGAIQAGVLTINGQAPDSSGDFSGLVEGSGNIGDDTKPVKIVSGTATAVTDALAKDSETVHGSGNVGSDIKPVKVVNGEAVAVTNALMSTVGDQKLAGNLTLLNSIRIPDITGSTLIRAFGVNALDGNGDEFNYTSMQTRRYANRTRWRVFITRYMDTPVGGTSLIFDVFDSGRVYLFIENIINGTTTNHTIIDSTP